MADVWRIAEEPIPGFTEERRADLLAPDAALITYALKTVPPPGAGASSAEAMDADAVTETRGGQIGASCPLWEWCRVPDPENLKELPAEMWGVYSEVQNTEIEVGYQ